MKYQPWYALGELVDNAIQSHLANKEALLEVDPDHRLVVSIEFERADGGSITVTDNAAGIDARNWERAFRVAEPPADASGLSQFGVGMKAACCWFAREWSLRTKALASDVSRTVSFNVPEIVASRDETLVVLEEPMDVREHFTVIEMRNLHRPVNKVMRDKVTQYLGGIYRQFIRDKELTLLVDGTKVDYDDPPVLVAPLYNDAGGELHTWRQDVDIRLDSGRRVTGFVAIRETGQTRQAGIALFYRRKVVTGSGEEFYKPYEIFKSGNSFESQRIFGELHMDDFAVTYTKDALVWYDEEDEFVDLLRAELDAAPWPLIRQAREHRKRTPEQEPGEAAKKMLDHIVEAFVAVEHDIEGASGDDTSTEQPVLPGVGTGQPEQPPGPPVDRVITIDFQGTTWDVDLRLVSDNAVLRWLTVKKEGDRSLVISVNQAHPFMRAFCETPSQELEPVWRVAVALGLAQEMARLGGAVMPGLVTENVNALLRGVLAHKS
nr:ATP-binding protein [Nocardioides perillae]